MRACPHCQAQLAPSQLLRERSAEMEAERRARGLEGVRFRYYVCRDCGYDDVFLDVVHLPGESDAEFACRKAALEKAVRALHAEQTEVIINPK